MRIKEGDPLEIFTHNKDIILKKYQPMVNIDEYAQTIADSLFDTFNNVVFVVDDKEIVAASGAKKKEYLKRNTESVFPQFHEAKNMRMDEDEEITIGKEEEKKANGYVYVPIMNGEKWLGAIFMLGSENKIDETMKQSLLIQKQFVERMLSGKRTVVS